MKRIKRGSFTVEAAVIIPLTVLTFALLLGFAYYTHQRVWCTGAVYESLLAASQRREGDSHTPREEADEHLSARINEAPLLAKGISGSTDGMIPIMSLTGVFLLLKLCQQQFPLPFPLFLPADPVSDEEQQRGQSHKHRRQFTVHSRPPYFLPSCSRLPQSRLPRLLLLQVQYDAGSCKPVPLSPLLSEAGTAGGHIL